MTASSTVRSMNDEISSSEQHLVLWRLLAAAYVAGARAMGANMGDRNLNVQVNDAAEGYAAKQLRNQEAQTLASDAAERHVLHHRLNTPELLDFREAIVAEAAHQRQRWGSAHDGGKSAADWHWLIAHLAGRAVEHAVQLDRLQRLSAPGEQLLHVMEHHREKAVHHVVTTGAAIANWHAHMLGLTNMRPGIVPPAGHE